MVRKLVVAIIAALGIGYLAFATLVSWIIWNEYWILSLIIYIIIFCILWLKR